MQRGFTFSPPSIVGSVFETVAGLAAAAIFAGVCATGLQGHSPFPWPDVTLGAIDPSIRVLLVGVGFFCGVIGMLAAATGAARTWFRVAHRWRLVSECESVGPFRLVEEDSGLWGLQLELGPAASARSNALFFRLDEGTVGALSRVFDPDETLYARWIDLPLSNEGPILLELRPQFELIETSPEAAPVTAAGSARVTANESSKRLSRRAA